MRAATRPRAFAAAGLLLAGQTFAAEPPKLLPKLLPTSPPPAAAKADDEVRVVAYIHGTHKVTRDELYDFLIARGGMAKLELLVNKRVIDAEAAKRGVTVTADEVRAAVVESLPVGVGLNELAGIVQKRYGKTLPEWGEDVVRPRLVLGKMLQGQVTVPEEQLRKEYEARYGEKRHAQIIVWPAGEPVPTDLVTAARQSEDEFNKLAAAQKDPKLAQSVGRVAPVGRVTDAGDPAPIEALFNLKVGEVSGVIATKDGNRMVVKCTGIVPPDATATFEKVRPALEKELTDLAANAKVGPLFEELNKAAAPNYLGNVTPAPAANNGVVQAGAGQPPAPAAPAVTPAPAPQPGQPGYHPQALAYVYGNQPVTREDLGEFLIARGGAGQLELLVNRKILELEASRAGVTVTPEELEAGYDALVKGAGVNRADFEKIMLPGRGLTKAQYVEDVVRPDLILTKLVADKVAVTEDDLKKAFESRFGEKRDCRIILWPKGQEKQALQQWSAIRKAEDAGANGAEFERVARTQSNENLAAAAGKVEPVARHLDAEDPVVEQVAFSLKPGEMSHLIQTRTGVMCIRCVGVVPPVAGASLEEARPSLEAAVRRKKTNKAIADHFEALKKAADPNLLLKGPPTAREFEDGVRALSREAIDRLGAPPR